MIVDKIENANLYTGLSKIIAKALELLKDADFAEKQDGRYDIDGDNLFYFVQRYQTAPAEKNRLEAHKEYIDVQVVLAGREIIGYAPTDGLTVSVPYEKDVVFFETPENLTEIKLSGGMFAIFYPADAHMPKCQLDSPSDVLKVVVKVKIDA